MAPRPRPPLHQYVGRVIHVLRQEHGMRQSELASLTGLKQPNLSRIENGLVVPRRATLKKIAQALALDLEELLSEETARKVETKWNAALSPKNAGQLFSSQLLPVPLFRTAEAGPLVDFDASGLPVGNEELILQLLPHQGPVFATRVWDRSMEQRQESGPSFVPGEVLVFAQQPPVRSGELAYLHFKRGAAFRRVFFEPGSPLLQLLPLNRSFRSQTLNRSELRALWRLIRHIRDF